EGESRSAGRLTRMEPTATGRELPQVRQQGVRVSWAEAVATGARPGGGADGDEVHLTSAGTPGRTARRGWRRGSPSRNRVLSRGSSDSRGHAGEGIVRQPDPKASIQGSGK